MYYILSRLTAAASLSLASVALIPASAAPAAPAGGGATCGYDYLCVARRGYDAPTGLGSPDGIGAF